MNADGRTYPTAAENAKVGRRGAFLEPSLQPSLALLSRHRGLTLDPGTAVRLPGAPAPMVTIYVGDQLLIRPDGNQAAVLETLQEAARAHGLRAEVEAADVRLEELARQAGIPEDVAQPLLSRVRLVPDVKTPAAPPDAWPVLQTFRALLAHDREASLAVHLDHLLSASSEPRIGGVPLTSGHAVDGPTSEFGVPGHGGRSPVAWVGPEPVRLADDQLPTRRPVIAVLDTGAGTHAWLPDEIVNRSVMLEGTHIGLFGTGGPESGAVDNQLTGALDADSGHGTFIAGLIRQTCPDADILAIRVMASDGIVSEGNLLLALNQLWVRQALALAPGGDPSQLIDVVTLSLGYYHEQPADAAFDPLLLTPLRALGALGVAVIASAGNDATLRPMYPAAFAPYPEGATSTVDPSVVPVTAVGSLNPGGTVAMFSNEGDWVSCRRPGSALVSTIPNDIDASGQPTSRTVYEGEVRETLDPDDFRSGFATWSGTSFSAPILAGELAQALFSGTHGSLNDAAPAATVARVWSALTALDATPRTPGEPVADGAPDVE